MQITKKKRTYYHHARWIWIKPYLGAVKPTTYIIAKPARTVVDKELVKRESNEIQDTYHHISSRMLVHQRTVGLLSNTQSDSRECWKDWDWGILESTKTGITNFSRNQVKERRIVYWMYNHIIMHIQLFQLDINNSVMKAASLPLSLRLACVMEQCDWIIEQSMSSF